MSVDIWKQHHTNWRKVLDLLQESQKLAKEIRETIESAPRHRNPATGQVTYGLSAAREEEDESSEEFLTSEEVLERINRMIASKG